MAAKNELKRAHLEKVETARMTARDKEVWALEEEMLAEIRKNMSDNEKEQLEILEEHEQALTKNKGRKRAKARKTHG